MVRPPSQRLRDRQAAKHAAPRRQHSQARPRTVWLQLWPLPTSHRPMALCHRLPLALALQVAPVFIQWARQQALLLDRTTTSHSLSTRPQMPSIPSGGPNRQVHPRQLTWTFSWPSCMLPRIPICPLPTLCEWVYPQARRFPNNPSQQP